MTSAAQASLRNRVGKKFHSRDGLFVHLDEYLLDVITKYCKGVELKLALQIMKLCNRAKLGDVFGWGDPATMVEASDACNVEPQRLNCDKQLWSETSLFARMDAREAHKQGLIDRPGGARSYTFRIRGEYLPQWARDRQKDLDEEAERKAAAKAIEEEVLQVMEEPAAPPRPVKPYALPKPVKIGPGRVFKLPQAAQVALANCCGITATREGTLTRLHLSAAGILELDLESAVATRSKRGSPAGSNPPPNLPQSKASFQLYKGFVAGNGVTAGHAQLFADLRNRLDRRFLSVCGCPIDTTTFDTLVANLGPLTIDRATSFLVYLDSRQGRKMTSWGFLPWLVGKFLETERRVAELAADAPPPRDETPTSSKEEPEAEVPPAPPERAAERERLRTVEQHLKIARKDLRDAGTSSMQIERVQTRIHKWERERDSLKQLCGA